MMRKTTVLFACLAAFSLAGMVGAQCAAPMAPGTAEGFESMPGTGNTGTASCVSPPTIPGTFPFGNLPAGWTHGDLPAPFPAPPVGANANNWFRSDAGGTGSGGTGPATDVTTGSNSGIYLYLETSGGCGSAIAYLNAPPLDATTVATPAVEFWYHMQGTSMGTLKVEAWNDDGVNPAGWVTVWSQAGDQGNQWFFQQVKIVDGGGVPITNNGATQQCINEVRVRFVGIGGGGFTSDMAIDEVFLGEATPAKYDTNSDVASTTIDGVEGGEFFPTIINKNFVSTPCSTVPAVGNAVISTSNNPGAQFEIVLGTGPIIPLGQPGAVAFAGGQIVNVDVGAFGTPALTFMNGGILPVFAPFPGATFVGWNGGSINIPFAVSAAATISVQSIILGGPNGFEISLPTQTDVINNSFAQGPVADELGVALDVFNAPFCWATGNGGISFYGTTYPTIFMMSNGRIRFDNGIADFGTSVATAQINVMMGVWSDFNTSGGDVQATSPAPGVVRVDYINTAYFGGPSNNNWFYEFDTTNGSMTIGGLTGFDLGTTTSSGTFLGISPGSTGGIPAADNGALVYTVGGSSAVPGSSTALEMTYDFGGTGLLPPSIIGPPATGLASVIFTTNVVGGYDWAAF